MVVNQGTNELSSQYGLGDAFSNAMSYSYLLFQRPAP